MAGSIIAAVRHHGLPVHELKRGALVRPLRPRAADRRANIVVVRAELAHVDHAVAVVVAAREQRGGVRVRHAVLAAQAPDLSENRRGLRDKELLSNSKALRSDLRS